MKLKPIVIYGSFENIHTSSLPILIQLKQDISLGTDYLTSKPGTTHAGNLATSGFAFSIEIPNVTRNNMSPSFSEIYSMMQTFNSPKMTKKELFEKFWIIKIPDYGNQTHSLGVLDFVPSVYLHTSDFEADRYKRISNKNIGIIRSYTNKEAFLLLDKRDNVLRNNSSTINNCTFMVVLDYKRFSKKKMQGINADLKDNSLRYSDTKLEYKESIDEYYTSYSTNLNSISEDDLRGFSLYATINNKIYRLNNSELFRKLKINGELVEEIVSKQIDKNNEYEHDYFKMIMKYLYNLDSIYGKEKEININISFENPFKDSSPTIYIARSSYFSDDVTTNNFNNYGFSSYNQFKVFRKTNANELFYNKLLLNENYRATYNNGMLTNFEFADGYNYPYEIVNNYDSSRCFMFKYKVDVDGECSINIHNLLAYNKIFKNSIDLNETIVELYEYESSNNNYRLKYTLDGDSTIKFNSKKDNIIELIIRDNIGYHDNIETLTYNNITVSNNLTEIYYDIFDRDQIINKATLSTDPMLICFNDSDKLSDNDSRLNQEYVMYDAINTDIENALFDGEIRLKKNASNKYVISANSTYDSTVSESEAYNNEKEKLEENIESYKLKLTSASTNNIEKEIATIKNNLLKMYIETSNEDVVIKRESGEKFLYMVAISDEERVFDIEVRNSSGILIKKEYDCVTKKYNNSKKYYYVHLPYYTTYENKATISIIPRDNKTAKISQSYIK